MPTFLKGQLGLFHLPPPPGTNFIFTCLISLAFSPVTTHVIRRKGIHSNFYKTTTYLFWPQSEGQMVTYARLFSNTI